MSIARFARSLITTDFRALFTCAGVEGSAMNDLYIASASSAGDGIIGFTTWQHFLERSDFMARTAKESASTAAPHATRADIFASAIVK